MRVPRVLDSPVDGRCIIRHGESPRLHHPGLGAVCADADPRAARRNAGAGLSRRTRSARACGRHPLSADTARLPARARRLPRRDRSRRRDPAAHRRHRRRRRGRDRFRAGGDRRPCRRGARSADGDRRARAPPAAGAARAQVGRSLAPDRADDAPLVASNPAVGARARRRSRPPDGRHDHAPGVRGTGSTSSSRTSSTAIGSSRSNSSRSRARLGPTFWPSAAPSSRPRGATP